MERKTLPKRNAGVADEDKGRAVPVRIPNSLREKLRDRKEETGIAVAEQIRRGIVRELTGENSGNGGLSPDDVALLLETLGKISRAVPVSEVSHAIRLPIVMSVPCGEGAAIEDLISDAYDTLEINGELAERATENSFIAIANGLSMENGNLPNSISSGDKLLLTPFDEFTEAMRPGLVVLAKVRYETGDLKCTLKQYMGKRLRANNSRFTGVEFGDPKVKEVVVLAVCRGVIEKVFA